MGFSHELVTYLKSNEWAQRTSEISDTKATSTNPVQSAFRAVIIYYTHTEILLLLLIYL